MIRWFTSQPRFSFAPLTTDQSRTVQTIHKASFARGWDRSEFERLFTERGIVATGVYVGWRRLLKGFALSRIVLEEAEILTLAIAPDWRSRGLGQGLLGTHLGMITARGATHVVLEVESGNIPAIHLYRRFGFVEVGQREAYYAKADGTRATAFIMRKDF